MSRCRSTDVEGDRAADQQRRGDHRDQEGRAGTQAHPISRPGVEPVAHQPHGLQRRAAERLVDALPQLPYVHLDDVGVALEGEVPDVLEDRGLGQHLAGAAASGTPAARTAAASGRSAGLPRQTRCSAGSSPRSPTVRTAGRSPPPRRSSARIRAISTTNENGLARKSSAPASRARASSSAPDRAVSIRIGTQLPAVRSRAQSSSPASPGSITSSTRASYVVLGREPLAVGAGQCDVDGVSLALEPATHRERHVLVVLDDQDPHPRIVPPRAEAPLNRRMGASGWLQEAGPAWWEPPTKEQT